MKTVASVACLGVAVAIPLAAQQSQLPVASSSPSFEVASVKFSNPDSSGDPLARLMRVRSAADRFMAANVPLRHLVRLAYDLEDFRIDGGPSWQMSQRFDISAKAEDGFKGGEAEMMPMLRTLLADRFKLRVHMETRDLPIHALVIARDDGRLGRNLKPSSSDCPEAERQKLADTVAKGGIAEILGRPGETRRCVLASFGDTDGVGLRANGQPMSVIAQMLTGVTGRIVQDKTGLTGLYDWEMKFDVLSMGVNLPKPANGRESNAPSLLTALREELGLKLESDRGPVEVLVIDGAELPTPD
jgi:uncharacterized protein (TIGR03435 family)